MKKRRDRERDDCRDTIMPGGQDPALLKIRCSVCICATRRGDDSSVLVALVDGIHEAVFVALATCAPTPLPRLSYLRLQYPSVSLSLGGVSYPLILCDRLIATTLTVPLGRTIGAKERGTMAQRSLRVLHHSLHLSLFLRQKWEGKETVNGRKRKRNKKMQTPKGDSLEGKALCGAQVNGRARVRRGGGSGAREAERP